MSRQLLLLSVLALAKSNLICNEETLVAACVMAFILLVTPSVYESVEGILLGVAEEIKTKNSDLLIQKQSVHMDICLRAYGFLDVLCLQKVMSFTAGLISFHDPGKSVFIEYGWTSEWDLKNNLEIREKQRLLNQDGQHQQGFGINARESLLTEK